MHKSWRGAVLQFTFPLLFACSLALVRSPRRRRRHSPSTSIRRTQSNCKLPGIGPSTAEKILQMRKSYGAFKSIDDLLAIRGVGQKRLEKMRKYLTVGRTLKAQPPAVAPKDT